MNIARIASAAGLLAVCLAAWPAAFAAESEEKAQSPIGRKVEKFTLPDFRGGDFSLADLQDKKLVIVAFWGTQCPLAKLYAPRLAEIAEKFAGDGVGVVAIDANRQDSLAEITAFAREHKWSFPFLKDVGNAVADQMGAVRTPEVFVLDQQRVVRYWGRIDDQYAIDAHRDAPKNRDLENALQELLAGKEVTLTTTEAPGCHIGRLQTPNADSPITYSNQIARILQTRCVECHRPGEIGPFSLTDYNEVAGWAATISEVVEQRRMPPWHADPKFGKFKNDSHLSDEERNMILRWAANGAPEGDPADLPEPLQYTSGWQLPREPDAVFTITEKPFRIPANGEVKYQYFTVDPKFTEDKWLQAAEILPGNRAVVHHILVFARPPGSDRLDGEGARGYLAGYVPGLRIEPLPDGYAKKIEAGSKLLFQVHYTPIGSEQFDQSKFGLLFADPAKVTREVRTTSAVNAGFAIPPQTESHEVRADSQTAPIDLELLGMMPHMHLRGKAFRYEAVYPDGKRETLLDIPHYHFNWQTAYRLSDPKTLPAGTKIHCTALFDNSEKNLNNPDPDKIVRWGDQTWEEMMIGYFDIAYPVGTGGAVPSRRPAGIAIEARLSRRAGEIIDRYDADKNGKVERGEVPEAMQRLFDRLDRNGDALLTSPELIEGFSRSEGRSP